MRAKDWMTIEPVTVGPRTSVADARKTMRLRGVRHLPVVEGGRVVGMLSDRDVQVTDVHLESIAEPGDVARIAGEQRPVAESMSAPVHVLGVDATVAEAARLMLSRRVNALPVVDADGVLAGLLTTTDCLLAFLSPGEGEGHG